MTPYAPLMIGLEGTNLHLLDKISNKEIQLINGYILYRKNFESVSQLQQLTKDIQDTRQRQGLSPALIAVDHEGGRVQRFSKGYFTALPRANDIGTIYKHDKEAGIALSRAAGLVTAAELGSCGINFCLGPSLDLNTNFSNRVAFRAYCDDVNSVIALSSHVLTELKKHGMAAAGKHFPGFGAAVFDTHSHFPIIEESWESIDGSHLRPFKAVIEQQLLSALMLTHGAYIAIDLKPVAGSSFWLQEVLRQKMNYDGVIMTDCLGMVSAKPLGQNYSSRISNCMKAGCDIVLISYSFNSMFAIIKKLANDEHLQCFMSSPQAQLSQRGYII